MARRSPIDQELFIRRLAARTISRLRHRMAAENELNATMEGMEDKFIKQIQKGVLPAKIDDAIAKLLNVDKS
jgi:hypothetical protein